MLEFSANQDKQENKNSTLSSTTTKLSGLNVSATEFVPSFLAKTSTMSLSTPVVIQNTTEDENKEPFTTIGDGKYDDFPDERVFDDTTTNKINIVSGSTIPKAKKSVTAKRDIVRKKESVNIVFCGHVDAGKSTICGQLMFLTGQVDERTLAKYKKEAQEKSRESWHFAWAVDTNEEERDKGKTVEFGRAWFETDKKHVIILDAPGHKYFVPNRIAAAAQADVAILIISARKGEFETGFERDGQTREHAMLVKTAGVRSLIVLINKMDDPTVNWDEKRYDEICNKLIPHLKKCGFQPDEDVIFMPCSGMTGAMLKEHPGEQILSWYKGPTFIEYLDSLPSFNRNIDGPLRMPIVDKYKEMGVIVMGKVESGCCRVGDRCLIMPNRTRVEITNIYYDEIETDSGVSGENIRLKLKNIEEEEISLGFILCDIEQEPCSVGRVFDAQVAILDCKSIKCCEYSAVLHIHAATVEVKFKQIITLIDRKTGEKTGERPNFIKQDQVAIIRFELLQAGQVICMESFKRSPRLSRFTLRDGSRTIAVGKVLKIVE